MRDKILKEFQVLKKVTARRLAKKLKISRQAVHQHITVLIREGKILKLGTSRKTACYVLNQPAVLKKIWGRRPHFHKLYRSQGLEEGEVLQELIRQPLLLHDLAPHVSTLFRYAFTEMLNNAIDHARSRFVFVDVESTPQEIRFIITDRGVGIFENIRAKKNLMSEMEAIQDLLKGKQTTAPRAHSGEGIFFTSKVADRLIIESHRKSLIVDQRLKDIFVRDVRLRKGTRVTFELSKRSPLKLENIFRQYTNEDFQFSKSRVTVKLFQDSEEYVSRSQAKRLLHSLDRFQEVILDFKDVSVIGQGFADEIFRIFPVRHPGIVMTPINCHENVEFMIKRAKSLASSADHIR